MDLPVQKVVLKVETLWRVGTFQRGRVKFSMVLSFKILAWKRAKFSSLWAENKTLKTQWSLWMWPFLLAVRCKFRFLTSSSLQSPALKLCYQSLGLRTEARRRRRKTDTADCETWNLLYQNNAWAQRIRSFIVYSHDGSEGDSHTVYCR